MNGFSIYLSRYPDQLVPFHNKIPLNCWDHSAYVYSCWPAIASRRSSPGDNVHLRITTRRRDDRQTGGLCQTDNHKFASALSSLQNWIKLHVYTQRAIPPLSPCTVFMSQQTGLLPPTGYFFSGHPQPNIHSSWVCVCVCLFYCYLSNNCKPPLHRSRSNPIAISNLLQCTLS